MNLDRIPLIKPLLLSNSNDLFKVASKAIIQRRIGRIPPHIGENLRNKARLCEPGPKHSLGGLWHSQDSDDVVTVINRKFFPSFDVGE